MEIKKINYLLNRKFERYLKKQLTPERNGALAAALENARFYSEEITEEEKQKMGFFDKLYSWYRPIRKNILEEPGITLSLATMQLAQLPVTLGNISVKNASKYGRRSPIGEMISKSSLSGFFIEAPIERQMVCEIQDELYDDVDDETREQVVKEIIDKYGLGTKDLSGVKDMMESAKLYPFLSGVREVSGWGSYAVFFALPQFRELIEQNGNVIMPILIAGLVGQTAVRAGVNYWALKNGYSADLTATIVSISKSSLDEKHERHRRNKMGVLVGVGGGMITQIAQTGWLALLGPASAGALVASYYFDNASFIGGDLVAIAKSRKKKKNDLLQ